MQINVFNKQRLIAIKTADVKKITEAVIALEKQNCHEVTVNFVSVKEISKLHALYFDDPSPTDCISFPMDDADESNYRILGEIFVCPQVAKEYAREKKKDFYLEITLYIVHGLLHLIGYDDIKAQDKVKMRAAEARNMRYLKKNHLVLKEDLCQ